MKAQILTLSHSATFSHASACRKTCKSMSILFSKRTAALLCTLLLIAGYCNAACNAGYTYLVTGNTSVSFTNTSTGGNAGTRYFWDFGDGSYVTATDPIHDYIYNGTYQACLFMSDSDTISGCYNQVCKSIVITNGADRPCTANFFYFSDSTTGGGVQFYDESTGNPVSWLWSFGDGTTSTAQYPLHVYPGNGAYIVCLTSMSLTDTCSHCDSIYVNGAGCGLKYYMNVYDASCNTCNDGSAGIVVSGGAPPYSYNWSTGATTATISNLLPGNYTYLVTDTAGCSISGTTYISYPYIQQCSVSLALVQDTFNLLKWYVFHTETGIPPFNYLWSFGDGDTSTLPDPSHTYTVAGRYEICLNITDSSGCFSSSCDSTYRVAEPGLMQYLVPGNPVVTGINESQPGVNAVFPNPANDRVEVMLNQVIEGQMTVTDMLGRETYNEKISSNHVSLDVSGFSRGCYNLSIVSQTGVMNEKIMISR